MCASLLDNVVIRVSTSSPFYQLNCAALGVILQYSVIIIIIVDIIIIMLLSSLLL